MPSPLKGEGSKVAPPLRGGVGEGVKISTLYTDSNETPRRRDSGVSLGRFINFNNPPLPPFSKVGVEETPQQRLRGIENLINFIIRKQARAGKKEGLREEALKIY